ARSSGFLMVLPSTFRPPSASAITAVSIMASWLTIVRHLASIAKFATSAPRSFARRLGGVVWAGGIWVKHDDRRCKPDSQVRSLLGKRQKMRWGLDLGQAQQMPEQ